MEKTESLPKEITEKITMTDSLPKEIFKKVIKKIFTYEFEDLKQTENYIELLNIAKKTEGMNLNKWLLLKALEVMFIDNGKLENKLKNDDAIKYFEYIIDKKSHENDTDFKKKFELFINHKKYSQIFEKLDISPKEKIIIEFIGEITKDSKIFFCCLDTAYSMKFPNYVPSQAGFAFSGKFQDFLDEFQTFLIYHDFSEDKEYFSLEYDEEEGFKFKEYSFEEADSILTKMEKMEKSTTFKDINKFINNNKIQITNLKKDDNPNQSNIKIDENEIKDEDEKNAFINNKIEPDNNNENKDKEDIKYSNKDEKSINTIKEEIKKELEEIYGQKINSLQKKYDEVLNTLNKVQKNHDEDKHELIRLKKKDEENDEKSKFYEEKIRSMKKSHKYDVRNLNKQIKDLESKINKKEEKNKQLQDKFSSAKTINTGLKNDNDKKNEEITNLKKDKDEINKKLDTIHCRVLSKTIIDFLYYVFTSNFKDNTYKEEKNTIIKEIEKKKGEEFSSHKKFLSELIGYLEIIYNKKLEGDEYAHPLVDFQILNGLIGFGYENVINIFQKLDLTLLLRKYNEFYKLNSEADISKINNIKNEIMNMLPDKRDNFLQLIRNREKE